MTEFDAAALLTRLRAARATGVVLPTPLPSERPPDVASAYEIAAILTQGHAHAGWKVGATNERARATLGVTEPFYGRILQDTVHRSPATIRLCGRTLTLDAEIGLELGTHLPARPAPYSRGEVAAAVRRVLPILEVNSPSFVEPFEAGALCLIADNGVNAGAVLGSPGSVRLDEIPTVRVTLKLDGERVVSGAVPPLPDDPLSILLWLVNTLSTQGLSLEAGQVVATGALAPPLELAREAQVEADFGALGGAQANLVT